MLDEPVILAPDRRTRLYLLKESRQKILQQKVPQWTLRNARSNGMPPAVPVFNSYTHRWQLSDQHDPRFPGGIYSVITLSSEPFV